MIRFSKTTQAFGAPIIDGIVMKPEDKSLPNLHGVGVIHPRQWFKRQHDRKADAVVCVAWKSTCMRRISPRLMLFDLFGNRPCVRKVVSALSTVVW